MLTLALQLLELLEKGVEDCKKRFSPDLRTSALYKLGLMHRDNINAKKQNGFGMARDLQLITGNWAFELLDVPPGYQGPLHIWQGGEDWTPTWCNCMSFLEKGICLFLPPWTRDTETRFRLCSARCISRARPKPYTLSPKEAEAARISRALRQCHERGEIIAGFNT